MGLSTNGAISCPYCNYYTNDNNGCIINSCKIYDIFFLVVYIIIFCLCSIRLYQACTISIGDNKKNRRIFILTSALLCSLFAVIRPFNYIIWGVNTIANFMFIAAIARIGDVLVLIIFQFKLLSWVRILGSATSFKIDVSFHGIDYAILGQLICIVIAAIIQASVAYVYPKIYFTFDEIINILMGIIFAPVLIALIYSGLKIYNTLRKLSQPPVILLKKVKKYFFIMLALCTVTLIALIVITITTISEYASRGLINATEIAVILTVLWPNIQKPKVNPTVRTSVIL